MLTSIKGKLINVSKNVGLLNKKEDNSHDPECLKDLNLSAGAELLNHFQQQWIELHNLNESNAKNADVLDEEIMKFHTAVNKNKTSIIHITQLLANMPSLKDSIDKCVTQISNLHDKFEVVENELLNLEDLIEQVELEEKKREHKRHLHLYETEQILNLETLKTALSTNYVQNLTTYELKRKRELEERQQVFQEAFKNDIETYKKFGTIPKIDIPKQQSALLEEIDIDYDEKELDKFFGDSN